VHNQPKHVPPLFQYEACNLLPLQERGSLIPLRFPVIGTTKFKTCPLGAEGTVKRAFKDKVECICRNEIV
jgi:hypothetical protein